MNGLTSSRQTAAVKVAAWGMVESSPDELVELRKSPGPWSGDAEAPATHLKLADEQAVLATAALLRAVDRAGWQNRSFTHWAVVAAPKFLGRVRGAAAIARYHRLGPRAMPPILIPMLSLHSISGVVSLILQSHGSNFGISGERSHVGEALSTGLALQDRGRQPGLWVILTGWEPEPILDDQAKPTNPITGYGIALALIDSNSPEPGMNLVYDPQARHDRSEPTSISAFASALQNLPLGGSWTCPVECGGMITLRHQFQQTSRAA